MSILDDLKEMRQKMLENTGYEPIRLEPISPHMMRLAEKAAASVGMTVEEFLLKNYGEEIARQFFGEEP